MDKTVLKNFAIYARNKLIQDTKNKASMIGITEQGIQSPLPESTSDMLVFDIKAVETYKIYNKEVEQYRKLIDELKKREANGDYKTAYTTLIEEVAYTWFNRMIAIRFMEVNDYLLDRLRILSSNREGVNEPEFVTNYEDTSLDLTDKEREQLASWKMDGSAEAMENMFRLLFVKQCNTLNKNLPELFEETNDYAELLLTISYNDPNGVLYKLVHDIPEEYFDIESKVGGGQVEIIGWMYQYYNTERRDEVINIIGKKTVKKADIPAATQLFTTDWVVRYMVYNSLGKYWLERNPDSPIRESLEYLMPGEISLIDEKISPEDLKVFDNAMGSGHCLSYAFDVLLKIYESEGYTTREASKLIVEKNLYGLDIDKRAYQLAYFAVMMKARQYNRRALNGELKTNIKVFEDSTNINKSHLEYLGLSMDSERRKEALKKIDYLIREFENATEVGSILRLENFDKVLVLEFVNDSPIEGQIMMGEMNIEDTQAQLQNLVQVAIMLTRRYDVMVTNPPYLNKFAPTLKKYIWDNYEEYKGDIFSVFIYHNIELCKLNGYSAYMTPNVWMFIKSFEKLREYLVSHKHIDSLVQIAKGSFYKDATVDIMTFVIKNSLSKEKGKFIRLEEFKGNMEEQRIRTLHAIQDPECGYYYETAQMNFAKISGIPIAYWASINLINNFKERTINDIATVRQGMTTSDNNRFLRLWFEIDINKASFNTISAEEALGGGRKWFSYNKGGEFRKWFGNREYVLNYYDNGRELEEFHAILNKTSSGGRLKSREYYFKQSVTWSFISSSKFGVRYSPVGSIFDVAGSSLFCEGELIFYILGFLASKIAVVMLDILNPTLNFQAMDIKALPIIVDKGNKDDIDILVKECIDISRIDWDSFETSWDFAYHPLLNKDNLGQALTSVEIGYENWRTNANQKFDQQRTNEKEINHILIGIYGLKDELTPEVSDKDITVTRIFDTKDDIYDDIKGNRYILTKEDVIKSFISYAIGCMFGRYSLDVEGLAYAGGDWDSSKYSTFIPAKDNIILMTDEEYFEDDIVNRFIDFVRAAYGEDTLQENLKFIADALGGNGTPREVIRNYFIKDFYNDHLKTYQKRPIYWQYDSGRQNGFKALIYMHRYNKDTTGKLRIDYLHEIQKAYERAIDNVQYDIENNSNPREVAKLEKRLTKLTKQLKECKDYDEKIAHLALARIPIDLDDGVKVNYDKVQTDEKGKKLEILTKIR